MSMSYRPKIEVVEALNGLKEELYLKTNSKVLDHVLLNFSEKLSEIRQMEGMINYLNDQLTALKRVHIKKKSAELQLDKLLDDIEY
jgi:hypothetical protein